MTFPMTMLRFLIVLLLACPGCVHAAAAIVEFAIGNGVTVQPNGAKRPIKKSMEVNAGELIDTRSGRVQLRFTDGAFVSLQPNTKYKIDSYNFSGKVDGSEKGFFSLLRGGLRTVSGLIGKGKHENYKLDASVATIGIRGTEFFVMHFDNLVVTTTSGKVDVCNNGGCSVAAAGESVLVRDINSAPVQIQRKAALSASTQSSKQSSSSSSGEGESAGASESVEVPIFKSLDELKTAAGLGDPEFPRGTATYTVNSFTTPTISSGTIVGSPFVTGALWANFDQRVVDVMLGVSLQTGSGNSNFVMQGGGLNIVGAGFSGPASCSSTAACSATFNGTFAAPNASQATVGYQIDSGLSVPGTVSGQAIFQKTGN